MTFAKLLASTDIMRLLLVLHIFLDSGTVFLQLKGKVSSMISSEITSLEHTFIF